MSLEKDKQDRRSPQADLSNIKNAPKRLKRTFTNQQQKIGAKKQYDLTANHLQKLIWNMRFFACQEIDEQDKKGYLHALDSLEEHVAYYLDLTI